MHVRTHMHSCMRGCACESFEFYHYTEIDIARQMGKCSLRSSAINIWESAKNSLNQTIEIDKIPLNTNPICVENCVAVWWSWDHTSALAINSVIISVIVLHTHMMTMQSTLNIHTIKIYIHTHTHTIDSMLNNIQKVNGMNVKRKTTTMHT